MFIVSGLPLRVNVLFGFAIFIMRVVFVCVCFCVSLCLVACYVC